MSIEQVPFQAFAPEHKIVFGEGMRWHDSRLWMADMLGRKVYAYDKSGRRETVADVPGRPNGLGFLPDGSLLATSMEDMCLYRRDASGKLVLHADMSAVMTGYCGDMAVDAHGRAYVDDVGYRVFEGVPETPGRLLLVQPDGTASIQDEPIVFPNGLWITPDRQRLVYTEGRKGRMFEADLDADGTIRNKRLIVEFAGMPNDGLTIDKEGGIWLCQPYEKRVIRLEGSTITHQLTFPDTKPISLCLGGDDLKTLYVVAADYTIPRMAVGKDVWAALHTARVEVAGFPLL